MDKKGKEIDGNVKKFQELLKIDIKYLDEAKKDKRIKEETISAVDEGLIKIKKETELKVKEILEKISQFEKVKKAQQTIWGIIGVILILVAIILYYKAIFNI